MKQSCLYGKHVEISTDTYVGYLYAKPKQKKFRVTNVYSSIDSSDNKRFYFREMTNFNFPEVDFKF